jgi:hypothetical protein
MALIVVAKMLAAEIPDALLHQFQKSQGELAGDVESIGMACSINYCIGPPEPPSCRERPDYDNRRTVTDHCVHTLSIRKLNTRLYTRRDRHDPSLGMNPHCTTMSVIRHDYPSMT